jgi:hypothetical protein
MKYIVNTVAKAINDSETKEEALKEYEYLFKICKFPFNHCEHAYSGRFYYEIVFERKF